MITLSLDNHKQNIRERQIPTNNCWISTMQRPKIKMNMFNILLLLGIHIERVLWIGQAFWPGTSSFIKEHFHFLGRSMNTT